MEAAVMVNKALLSDKFSAVLQIAAECGVRYLQE